MTARRPNTDELIVDLRPHLPPGRISITLLTLAGILFLRLFEWNPHCTQEVSFGLAVFDMENHPEDKGWNGQPLIYQQPFVLPLRGALILLVLGTLFAPAIAAAAYRGDLITKRKGNRTQGALPFVAALVSLLPMAIIGERFQELLRASALVSLPLVLGGVVTMARINRWQARRQRELRACEPPTRDHF
ncbi:MAG TPA: hypothetical protein VGG33_12000 [Polyangia bacterium]